MGNISEKLAAWLQQLGMSESLATILIQIGAFLIILILALLVNLICKRTIIPTIRNITRKTEYKWDNYLLSNDLLKSCCNLISLVVIYLLIPYFLPEVSIVEFILKLCKVSIIIVTVQVVCAIISSLYNITNDNEKLKGHTLKGFYQMIKLVVICIGAIISISILVGKNPLAILTGLGAGTAILMLVFQDTIKGFVAGIQLMANDMLHPGDWITASKFNVDGEVIEVTLTTVKIRNWDNTITTLPPFALVNDSFQNWRGMFEAGGRRIKRSVNIDMNTIRFCTDKELEQFKNEPWMKDLDSSEQKVVNLNLFRIYVEHILRNHPKVNKEMTIMVRQLQPGPQGLPVELYFFSSDTVWLNYEHFQGEIFDHILATMSTFDLKVFQNPAGIDFRGESIN